MTTTMTLEEAVKETAALRGLLHAVVKAGGGRATLPAGAEAAKENDPARLSLQWDEQGRVIVLAD